MNDKVAKRDMDLSNRKKDFFDDVAVQHLVPGPLKRHYNRKLTELIRFNVPPGSKVIEIGCGVGDLLASVEPAVGVGVDFSSEMIRHAKERHPELTFIEADADDFKSKEKYDVVLLSNLVGELVDVERVLARLPELCHERTRIIITYYNYLWSPIVKVAEMFGIKPRQREQNWLELGDLENLLELVGVEPVKRGYHMLQPVFVPVVSDLFNGFIGNLPFISKLAVNQIVVSRLAPKKKKKDCKVSVIVACKDEKGNIEEAFRTLPKMGTGTELIFVDGHSEDGTVEEIKRCIGILKELNPDLDSASVYTQPGKGKGDAVRLGFDMATGDILMILDADLTVRPEDLPKFYDALISGKGEFINGSRLVYPMEDQAMRFLNMLGNHFFGWTFSWLLDQRLTDTLCGTKVLFKEDYEAIKRGRTFFGDFDPFGDFDLIFGAAKLNMKIREVPIRYRNREYGDIKISRFKHGVLLLKMSALAFRRFKLLNKAE